MSSRGDTETKAKGRKRTRKVREAALVQEYETFLDTSAADSLLTAKEDSELFVLDRGGSKKKKRKIEKATQRQVDDPKMVSKTEKVLLERMQNKQKSKGKSAGVKTQPATKEVFDMWGAEDTQDLKSRGRPRTSSQKKVKKTAGPGMSYNPSHEDHQEALAEAVALDLKHQESIVRNEKVCDVVNKTISDGADSSDSDGEPPASDDGLESDHSFTYDSSNRNLSRRERARRENVKLTRAQRNKLRSKRIANYERAQDQMQKNLEKGINQLPKHIKSVEDEEAKKKAQREFRIAQKEESQREQEAELAAMTYEEAGAVPLTDELTGSLRQLKPKGIPISSHVELMTASGDVADRNRRARKKREKPHAPKKVKWIPKYKIK